MRLLNSVMIRAIHHDLIEWYGGVHGLRDEDSLESAIARPRHLLQYEPEASVARLAAMLGWGLLKKHTFLDGSKRIALAAVVTFLRLNQHRLTCSEAEETVMVLWAAASEIDEMAWTAWMERSVEPLV